MLLRQAWKELSAEPRFALLFLFNLALGLSGLVSMEAFRASLQSSLQENAQNLMAADLSLTSRRPLTAAEQIVAGDLKKNSAASSETIETSSMIAAPGGSRLVLLRAVAQNYPLRGYIDLEKKGRVNQALLPADKIWMDPDLAHQLKLHLGDSLTIGAAQFIIDDFIKFDPTQSFRALALAGRIMLSVEALQKTGLIRPESTVSFTRLYLLSAPQKAGNLAKFANGRLKDPSAQAKAAGAAADDSGRMLGYLGDFLGLSALVALFLSSIGSAYLFRTWLVRRSRVLAVHQVLGLSFGEAASVPALQSLLLAIGAVPIALILGRLELGALNWLIKSLSPVEVKAALSWSSVWLSFAVASFGSFLLALPFLLSLRDQKPRDLLGGKLPEPRFGLRATLLFAPAFALLYGLSVYEAQSFRTAGVFLGSLLGSLLLLLAAGAIFLKVIGWLARQNAPWPIRHALLHLSRRGFNSLSAFVALALGALLLNLLPQLRAGLSAEMENPDHKKVPSLFLFDIQEEQLSPLQEKLKKENLELQNISPLIRSRLLKVNGVPFERSSRAGGFQTREEENEARFRNRGFNLSYRAGLTESETLTAGKPFTHTPDKPEISVEEGFAQRVGLKLGDALLFDVQGVEISGRIVNFRKVKWTSFQPNFFVVFDEGALEGAPKIFLGSLRDLPDDKKEAVQRLIAENFPNISSIDVKATVARVMELVDRMRWCLNLMSAISLFAGFVVLFSIANRQAELRRWDINLTRVLGAGAREIRFQQLTEFGLLSFAGGLTGSLISILFTLANSLYLFEGVFAVDLLPVVVSVLGTTILGLTVSWLGTRAAWNRNAAELLQEQAP